MIEKTQVVEPILGRKLTRGGLIVWFIPFILVAIILYVKTPSYQDPNLFVNLIGMAVIAGIALVLAQFTPVWYPYCLLTNKDLRRLTYDKSYVAETFLGFVGNPNPKYFDCAVSYSDADQNYRSIGTSGIALGDGCIYVMDHGIGAKIPWSEIRGWSWNIDKPQATSVSGGPAIVGGTAGAIAGSYAAASAARDARRAAQSKAEMNSGFHIDVADVDKPRWTFQSADEKVLLRWNEILTQVKEGRLAA